MAASFEFFYQALRGKDEYIAPHHHQCYELVYYAGGHGHTRIGYADYDFAAGDYAVIAPCTTHDERHNVPVDVMFAGFTSADYPSLKEGIYRDAQDQPVRRLMNKLAGELRDKRSYYRQMLDNLASELYLELLRSQPSREPDNRSDIVHYAQTFVDEYYMHPIDFHALASQSGYSYDRFRHMFKDIIGMSPTQYILQRRIEHAKAMLRHTRLQVAVIAMECGFATDSQFCSLFKRETGITPRQYRIDAGGDITS